MANKRIILERIEDGGIECKGCVFYNKHRNIKRCPLHFCLLATNRDQEPFSCMSKNMMTTYIWKVKK